MVSIKSLLISAAMAASAYGRIGGFSAPDTVQMGQNITATLAYRSTSSNWNDFGVIWGLAYDGEATTIGDQHYVGHFLSYDPIYPDYVNKNRTVSVPLGSYASPGKFLLTAAVPYLAGQSGTTDIEYFSQNITVTE